LRSQLSRYSLNLNRGESPQAATWGVLRQVANLGDCRAVLALPPRAVGAMSLSVFNQPASNLLPGMHSLAYNSLWVGSLQVGTSRCEARAVPLTRDHTAANPMEW
jgi:hypothetical protein